MKILLISTHNQSTYYVHAYETWKKSLELYCDVCYYGEGYPNFIGWDKSYDEVYKKINFVPDLEIWCGGKGNTKPQYIDNKKILKNVKKYKYIPKLILITDYWEIIRDSKIKVWNEREDVLKLYGVVGYISFYCQVKKFMKKVINSYFRPNTRNWEKIIIFPYVYDDKFTQYRDLSYKYDVNLQWHYQGYPFRSLVHKTLMKIQNLRKFHAPSVHYKDCKGEKDILYKYFGEDDPVANFSKLLNSSRITVADGYTKYITKLKPKYRLDGTDLFNARYPQVLASKSVLFSPIIESTHIEKIIDGVHYVCINENNFLQKIKFYLAHPKLLDNIVINANKWAERNCSMKIVGKRLYDNFEDVLKNKNILN